MVEAAIAGFLFLSVLFGIIEFGTAFFDYLTTSNMSRTGARTGSTLGNTAQADYQILQKLQASLNSMPQNRIQSIVIYKANANGYSGAIGATPSASCLSGGVSGVCNYYTPDDFARTSTDFGCGAASPDRFWCPTTRVVRAGDGSTLQPDYLGVYIQVLHPNVTGFFSPSWTFKESTVIRIEAQTP